MNRSFQRMETAAEIAERASADHTPIRVGDMVDVVNRSLCDALNGVTSALVVRVDDGDPARLGLLEIAFGAAPSTPTGLLTTRLIWVHP